jgi:hypothetical protein
MRSSSALEFSERGISATCLALLRRCATSRVPLRLAIALIVLVGVGCRLLADRERLQEQLRRITSRRKARAELSLVRVVAELLKREISLWELVNHDAKLNLEASL